MSKILTIDQGTTSSRSIIFDINGDIEQIAQEEYPLIFPNDGWVEIDPEDLYKSVTNTLNQLDLTNVEFGGITNQRETTIIWDKNTLKPVYNAIVWQDRRTSAYCNEIATKTNQSLIKQKTGLLIDSYFSATKIKWILDNVNGVRNRAEAGELCFGTVDTYLMYRLSEGKIFKTDITNASRTMLFNINSLSWDKDLLKLFDMNGLMVSSLTFTEFITS